MVELPLLAPSVYAMKWPSGILASLLLPKARALRFCLSVRFPALPYGDGPRRAGSGGLWAWPDVCQRGGTRRFQWVMAKVEMWVDAVVMGSWWSTCVKCVRRHDQTAQ